MLRKANISDAKKIKKLISFWAKKEKVLDKSLNYIYENIRDFWVYEDKRKIIGIAALHIVGWQSLAEIKSLVVEKKYHKKGIGKKIVFACIKEAKSLKVENVFALTFVADFFIKLGFKKINKYKLPHKIWSECINCSCFPDCKEEALFLKIK